MHRGYRGNARRVGSRGECYEYERVMRKKRKAKRSWVCSPMSKGCPHPISQLYLNILAKIMSKISLILAQSTAAYVHRYNKKIDIFCRKLVKVIKTMIKNQTPA
jgi:hypothetical protein